MNNNLLKTSENKIWLGDDGILRSVIQSENGENGQTGKRKKENAIEKLCNGKKRPFLADLRTFSELRKRKCNNMEPSVDASYISAMAMVVPMPMRRDFGFFFLGLHKPKYPVRPFIDEEEATAWLKKFL